MKNFTDLLGIKEDLVWESKIQISPDIVSIFVELTGDASSLHVNREFSKRSMYRNNIVHGMLPVLFLSKIPFLQKKEWRFSFQRVSARFLHPVFIDDKLVLTTKINQIGQDKHVHLEFTVKKADTQTILTTGSATIKCLPEQPGTSVLLEKQGLSSQNCIVLDSINEADYEFDDISKGDAAGLTIAISRYHVLDLYKILNEGMTDEPFELKDWVNHDFTIHLLASCICSTFVGMCIPGQGAIFLGFDISFNHELQWDYNYSFKGKVSFKSPTVLTLVESVSIHENSETKDALASGKINVKMNPPRVNMPSIASLGEVDGNLQLKDKVVLITGASGGIGETTSKLFALYGARVGVNYLNSKEEAQRVADEIRGYGGQACILHADVRDRSSVKEMVGELHERYGSIDILVNNAVRDAFPMAFRDISWDDLQEDLDVTLKGAFNCCQEVLPFMLVKGCGKIINISTVFSDNPPANQMKYVVSKNAVVGLTRSLAVEFARNNIQVNVVMPSIVETNLTKHVSRIFFEKMKNETPMKRNAQAVDVAKAVIFLASSLSSFTTGQKIMVTGGQPPFL